VCDAVNTILTVRAFVCWQWSVWGGRVPIGNRPASSERFRVRPRRKPDDNWTWLSSEPPNRWARLGGLRWPMCHCCGITRTEDWRRPNPPTGIS